MAMADLLEPRSYVDDYFNIDPVKLIKELWPHVKLYKQQKEIIYSVWHNKETYVPAGNKLGKDFVGGLLILLFFLTRSPCRIVTTSVKDDHLRVLWGEMTNFIQECKYPLEYHREKNPNGPLIVNHREIKQVIHGRVVRKSYIIGCVSERGEGLQGHHIALTGDGIPRTLAVGDEASGLDDECYKMMTTWANRLFFIGNCWSCENFFKHAVKGRPGTDDRGGDVKNLMNDYLFRKIIRIRAEDSPNVRYALAQLRAGKEPDDKIIVPGVKPYGEYAQDRVTKDAEWQCVSLDADWYEGPEIKMFPVEWLNQAETNYRQLSHEKHKNRKARAIGVDPAEGGDNTAMAAIDDFGLIELRSEKTPDTSKIPGMVLGFMREHGVAPENVMFDRGGGGKEHADHLRNQGYDVRTAAFGESVVPELKRGMTPLRTRKDEQEERTIYKNRRAEMYDDLRSLLKPDANGIVHWSLPIVGEVYAELRRQLQVIPRLYDGEGKLYLPPKQRKPGSDSKEKTMVDLIGHSPDEADALVLAVRAMLHKSIRRTAGAVS